MGKKKEMRLYAAILTLMLTAVLVFSRGTVFADGDVERDIDPPVIYADSVSLNMTGDYATPGDTVKFSLCVMDASDLSSLQVTFYNTEHGSDITFDMVGYDDPREPGLYVAPIPLSEDTGVGSWQLRFIEAYDSNDNYSLLFNSAYTDSDGSTPYAEYDDSADLSNASFIFRDIENELPEIDTETLSISLEGDSASLGDVFDFSVFISSWEEIIEADAMYYNVENSQELRLELEEDSETPGLYTAQINITGETAAGDWQLEDISVYFDNDLSYSWFNTEYTEADGSKPYADVGNSADLSAGNFTVEDYCKITFDTRGGEELDPMYVAKGEKLERVPEAKLPEGQIGYFMDWYIDEALSEEFNEYAAIEDDLYLYAKWCYPLSVCSYDRTNGADAAGGKFSISNDYMGDEDQYYGGNNYSMPEGTGVYLQAYPDEGYVFDGWYKGEYIGEVDDQHSQICRPIDLNDPETLISRVDIYETTVDESMVICPVFKECEHDWVECIDKATPNKDGRIYQKCSVCGMEETIAPLLKPNNIKLSGTSYVYKGKAIKPGVTVANAEENLTKDNYTVTYENNVKAGKAVATVTFKGDYYEGSRRLAYTITKATNPLNVTGKTVSVSSTVVNKQAKTVAAKSIYSFKNKGQGKLIYTKASGSNKLTVNKTTGAITVKKGTKKGTYTIKVKVTAAGNANYKSVYKIATVKITVK